MEFIERSEDRSESINDILRNAPEWVCTEISEAREAAGYRALPFKGRPNSEGTPEQIDANLHALTLRKLELLKEEASIMVRR